jgi:putative transposase
MRTRKACEMREDVVVTVKIINRTHKIQIDPTSNQQTYFRKACGISRFAWNWGLSKWEEAYKAGNKTNALKLKKEFNRLKAQEFPWVYEVTKYACQQPFIHLQKAFQGFFNKKTKYPKYKKKGVRDSFYIGGDQIKVVGKYVKIPNLGWVRLRESLRFEGKINGVTISLKADRWFISVSVETSERPAACESQAVVGVDLGIKAFATLSSGTSIPSSQPLKAKLGRLKRLQRKLSRRKEGSKNRAKAKKAVANMHYKVANSRNDFLHKITTELTEIYKYIVIEDLDVSEMVKKKRLSRAIMDCGWYEFRRQLVYKAELRDNRVFIVDKWFASTKQCSGCDHRKKEMSLSERTFICEKCHLKICRDLNAAVTLEKAFLSTVSSTGIDACGQDGSVVMLKTSLQPACEKRELNHV